MRLKLLEEVDWDFDGDVEDMWKMVSTEIKRCCEKVLGVYKQGTRYMEKETWWWDEEVARVISLKKKAYKKWQERRLQLDFEEYKQAKKAAERKVAQVQAAKSKPMYDRMETRE